MSHSTVIHNCPPLCLKVLDNYVIHRGQLDHGQARSQCDLSCHCCLFLVWCVHPELNTHSVYKQQNVQASEVIPVGLTKGEPVALLFLWPLNEISIVSTAEAQNGVRMGSDDTEHCVSRLDLRACSCLPSSSSHHSEQSQERNANKSSVRSFLRHRIRGEQVFYRKNRSQRSHGSPYDMSREE